jgi:hypothetical protein
MTGDQSKSGLIDPAAQPSVTSRGRRLCPRQSALSETSFKSDGSPGQQQSGAKRDQRKTKPIRFDVKAAARSFRFQGVAGLPGAKSPSAA